MSVTRPRPGSHPIRRLPAGLVLAAVGVLASHPLPALAAERADPAAGGACALPVVVTTAFPPELEASFQPAPAQSAPACPTPVTCGGNPTGYCLPVTDLGPCCTSGGATLCCPAGTTLKVRQCVYTWLSGILGRGFCLDKQLSCE